MPDNPDFLGSQKEKQARHSEILSVFQEPVSSIIGKSKQDVGTNKIVEIEDNMSANICTIWATYGGGKYEKNDSTTKLDTHNNMAVVGSQATVFHTGRTAEVKSLPNEL